MIGQKLILIKNVVVVACQTKELCSCQLPSIPTLNQVVITTTTTKILPCLPCVLSYPTVRTPCTTRYDRFTSDLAPRVADAKQFEDQPDLQDTYQQTGKIIFLDSDQIWIIGNIPDLHLFHRIYSQVLLRPAPLLTTFANTLHPNLPTTLDEWKHAQQNAPEFRQTMDPESLASINGLTIFKIAF